MNRLKVSQWLPEEAAGVTEVDQLIHGIHWAGNTLSRCTAATFRVPLVKQSETV